MAQPRLFSPPSSAAPLPSHFGLSIAELGQLLRRGDLSATRLTDSALERIASSNLDAFVAVTGDRARAAAARADQEFAAGIDRGPLHGIPFAIKDMIDVADVATTSQSRLFLQNVPARDAEVVSRLEAAGAIVVGKTATYELGIEPWPSASFPFPPARNPHNLTHTPGGSSSGSAAAVAGGLVRIALGTDTGGSIRSPAAYSGIVGLKPTYGRLPLRGVMPLSPSLDHVGILAATVVEAAAAFDALTGASAPACALATGEDVAGLRIAYARNFHAGAGEPAVLRALDAAAGQFARLGINVAEIELLRHDAFENAAVTILQAEAYALYRNALTNSPADIGRLARDSLMTGAEITGAEVAAAHETRRALTAQVDALLANCDAMIVANVLGTAPRLDGTSPPNQMRVFPFNLTGHPVLALPIGMAPNGLPLGLQLVGKRMDEAMLCRIGAAFEASRTAARPPIALNEEAQPA